MKILYRPSWQRLRVSFLAVNHPLGGFNTVDGTSDNLQRLYNYLLDAGLDPSVVSNSFEPAKAPAIQMPIPPPTTTPKVADWTRVENERFNYADATELALRLYRAINLLNATRMGYSGQQRDGSDMDLMVAKVRDALQPHYDGHTTQVAEKDFEKPDKTYNGATKLDGWTVVEYELETMWREDRFWFKAIHDDLAARAYRADRKQKSGKGGAQSIDVTRADLLKFIQLCDAINRHSN